MKPTNTTRDIIAAAIGKDGGLHAEIVARCPSLTKKQVEKHLHQCCARGEWVYVALDKRARAYFLNAEDAEAGRARVLADHAARLARQDQGCRERKAQKAAERRAKNPNPGGSWSLRTTKPKQVAPLHAQEVIGMDSAPRICVPAAVDYRHYVDPNQRIPGGFAEMGIGRYMEERA